jgi:uncharacterized protein (TIGR02466 family)
MKTREAETGPPTELFQTRNVLRLFPSFIWKGELAPEIYRPMNEAVLRGLGQIGAPLRALELGESWQSHHRLHELDSFRALRERIAAAAEIVLDYLAIEHGGFAITGCWANLNAPGAGHRAHSHPNNYVSGVYYVQVPPKANTINFLDPRPQAEIIRPPVRALTAENTEQVTVAVQDGTLLMFPAWLKHSVDANRSGEIRISLGFNIMFSSYAEKLARPLWQPGRRSPA